MTGIIFFDIDGTLISRNTHRMQASTLAALAELRRRGIKLVVCTGRGRSTMPAELEPHFDLFVALNGQYAYKGERVLLRHDFTAADTRMLLELGFGGEVTLSLECEEGIWINRLDSSMLADFVEHEIQLPDFLSDDQIKGKAIFGGSVFLDRAGEAALLAASENLAGTRWHPGFFDLITRGRGKGTALEEVCAHYGFPPSASMAMGDGENDLDMLQAAGIGVAMGNADAAVRAAADFVTADADSDGIALALRHFGLIS